MDSSKNDATPYAADGQLQYNQQQYDKELTPKILSALSELASVPKEQLEIEARAIAGVGENSYGLVMQVHLKTATTTAARGRRCILKIAPKNSARRSHMRVADYYAREVYMYNVVFRAYRTLLAETKHDALVELDLMMPNMFLYSLEEGDEFIIFEDLLQSNYVPGQRTQLADYEMAAMALSTLGKFHALSFALQAKKSEAFSALITHLQPDNLFTSDIDPISIEFGKSYIRRAHDMIEADPPEGQDVVPHLAALHNAESNFKEICLRCVDGSACAPYAVICHGDFWNNNILNKYDSNNRITSSKLIDFQMSRYASPILDLVHYLFTCTTQDLRKLHFQHLLHDVYYMALSQQLQLFELDVASIYPREVFDRQLRNYGAYGLCMAAFSLPFFIADTTELPDLDKVSEAIKDIGPSSDTLTTESQVETSDKELTESRLKLIDNVKILNARTALVFKSRMAGIVSDIIEYDIKTDFNNGKAIDSEEIYK